MTRDVTGALWRALAVLRVVLVGYALVVNVLQRADYQRPVVAWLVFGGVAAWSAVTIWFYATPRRRYRWVLVADVAVAFAALLLTPVALGHPVGPDDLATVPSYWIAAPVLACAIRGGWQGGLVAALAVGVLDVSIRARVFLPALGNVFLMCLAALVVGYSVSLLRLAARERADAAALAAATRERERLSRAVHDGVLQVLAYVQRRGRQIGGPADELADLAGEQEVALRGLVQANLRRERESREETTDVAAAMQRLAGPTVSVAGPGDEVPLPADIAAELVAACREAVTNAHTHAPEAPVYVLVEDDGAAVTVSVRDDGPGIPEGRLDEAAAAGRLGVRESIVGRVHGVGGAATLHTGTGTGTEWELRVPRSLSP